MKFCDSDFAKFRHVHQGCFPENVKISKNLFTEHILMTNVYFSVGENEAFWKL